MKSIRSWLFGVFPLIAISTLIGMDVRRLAVPTVDWRDLCVNGRGYIETRDDNGENPVWHRSIKLCVNQNGLLCANVAGKMLPIEPPISIPSGWTGIDIRENGMVVIVEPGCSGTTVGVVSLSTFYGDDITQATTIRNIEDSMGLPMVGEPGMSGSGYLMQRTSLQYCLPFTYKTSLAFVFFALWIAGIVHAHKADNSRQFVGGLLRDTPTALDSIAQGRGLAAHPGVPTPNGPGYPNGQRCEAFFPVFSLPLASCQWGDNWRLQATHVGLGSPPVSYRGKQRDSHQNVASTE